MGPGGLPGSSTGQPVQVSVSTAWPGIIVLPSRFFEPSRRQSFLSGEGLFGKTRHDVRMTIGEIVLLAGIARPNFLDVFLRKSLLRNDFLLICTAYCRHAMVFCKFLSCNELRDTPCTQKTLGESGPHLTPIIFVQSLAIRPLFRGGR